MKEHHTFWKKGVEHSEELLRKYEQANKKWSGSSRLALVDEGAYTFEPAHKIPMILHIQPCLKKWEKVLIHPAFFYETMKGIPHLLIKISAHSSKNISISVRCNSTFQENVAQATITMTQLYAR